MSSAPHRSRFRPLQEQAAENNHQLCELSTRSNKKAWYRDPNRQFPAVAIVDCRALMYHPAIRLTAATGMGPSTYHAIEGLHHQGSMGASACLKSKHPLCITHIPDSVAEPSTAGCTRLHACCTICCTDRPSQT